MLKKMAQSLNNPQADSKDLNKVSMERGASGRYETTRVGGTEPL